MSAAPPADGLPIEFGGETLHLLPDRTLWWPAQETLLLADLHLGKEATFRRAGIPIPDLLEADLERLGRRIAGIGCREVIVLGDLLHARQGRAAAVMARFAAWRQAHANVAFTLVRGNHDWHAGDPPAEWDVACVNEPWPLDPLQLNHRPRPAVVNQIAGHLHPKVLLRTRGERLNLPCFLERGGALILPAFGGFIDHGAITPEPGDRCFVTTGDTVVPLPSGRDPRLRRLTGRKAES
jgi:DNA ligase-associated metallophosphoesterase